MICVNVIHGIFPQQGLPSGKNGILLREHNFIYSLDFTLNHLFACATYVHRHFIHAVCCVAT